VLGACKKDKETEPELTVTASKRLVSYVYDYNAGAPAVIKYDDKGRVVYFKDDDSDEANITYNGSEVRIKIKRLSENRDVFNFVGQLNAAGNLKEGSAAATYNANDLQQVQYKFEYNSSGQLTRKIETYSDGIVYDNTFNYKNGNMESFKVLKNGAYSYGGTREYDPVKLDKSGLNWELGVPNTFTGKPNKNLQVKYTSLNENGTVKWFSTHENTLDSEGYLSKSTVNISSGNKYSVTYQFK
jgi:hypothetical protein